jgi:hypothetical protein
MSPAGKGWRRMEALDGMNLVEEPGLEASRSSCLACLSAHSPTTYDLSSTCNGAQGGQNAHALEGRVEQRCFVPKSWEKGNDRDTMMNKTRTR